ncbi:MAG: 50S ribosomal protein L13 [bacterium]|nr:50S ribosomal protein L13 [bacterium]
MKTYVPKKGDIEKKWYLVDAKDKVLGRLASRIALVLRGKHKPIYTPHIDTGDHVVVVNASQILLTGRKLKEKVYYRYSGYPGGLRSINAVNLLKKYPERVITFAVKGMLPKNKLGRKMLRKLRVYADESHPHRAQKLEPIEL